MTTFRPFLRDLLLFAVAGLLLLAAQQLACGQGAKAPVYPVQDIWQWVKSDYDGATLYRNGKVVGALLGHRYYALVVRKDRYGAETWEEREIPAAARNAEIVAAKAKPAPMPTAGVAVPAPVAPQRMPIGPGPAALCHPPAFADGHRTAAFLGRRPVLSTLHDARPIRRAAGRVFGKITRRGCGCG